jgi:hypothetical protein
VWFTGHSLGGALATLAAGRYERAPEVYTFGAPRVGDGEYVESLDTPVYRIVNGRDVVPKLPVRGPYRHAGAEKYIDGEGLIPNPVVHFETWTRNEILRNLGPAG